MPDDEMTCRDLYLKHTATGGDSRVERHRVWDADRFLTARQGEVSKLNLEATAKNLPARAAIALATEADFRAARAR